MPLWDGVVGDGEQSQYSNLKIVLRPHDTYKKTITCRSL